MVLTLISTNVVIHCCCSGTCVAMERVTTAGGFNTPHMWERGVLPLIIWRSRERGHVCQCLGCWLSHRRLLVLAGANMVEG
jgi:hypothetical protein